MKKLITVILLLALLLPAAALAELPDISGLSYDELVQLKDQINLAIWNSQEWQEVTVPQGEWIVGEDIPVGQWIVKCADINRSDFMMKQCTVKIYYNDDFNYVPIYNPNNKHYNTGYITEKVLDLKKGMKVVIDDVYAPAVFSTYSGKPDLGFN